MGGIQTPNGILEDISAEIGYTATTTLIDWLGGTSMYVPQVATDDHFVCKIIGMPAFRILVKSYGNEIINLPVDFRRERTQRNRLIGALLVRGTSPDEIARLSGVGLKQIGHVRTELQDAGILELMRNSDDLFLIEPDGVANENDFDTSGPEGVSESDEFEALVIFVGGVMYVKAHQA